MIRKLQKDEFLLAADLSLGVFMQFGQEDFNAEGLELFKSFVYSDDLMNELVVYGAFDGKELVGILGTKRMGIHISLFFIRKEYQGKGIGRKLFDFALQDNPVKEMTVNSSTYAIGVYQAFGFEKICERQETNGLKYTPMKRVSRTEVQ